MVKHLSFDLRTAYENGVKDHPQTVMQNLGITYQYSTPQTLNDSWWFWNCENIPQEIPLYLRDLEINNPLEYVGWGLSKEQAERIKDYPKLPVKYPVSEG